MDGGDFYKQDTVPGADKEPSSTPSPLPHYIGPYKIEGLLEKGGMSILYLGSHPKTHVPITIKVLSEKYLSHPEMVRRFLNEAEIIAMADHPNITKLYGHGEWERGLYIAMEYIPGISLRQYILQTPLSLKRALEIILDIAYAICHLHTHGVIHRDLKPENILVLEDGSIKVIDFGIAQLLTEASDQERKEQQRLIGTPVYMSPEQKENPDTVSYPSDIYSLGIIAYELVLGKMSHGQVHISLMPKGLQKILNKALQYKPEDRYQDVVDFITDVTTYLSSTTLQKDKKAGDQLSELTEQMQQAQKLLLPLSAPQWPRTKIGLATSRSILSGGSYFDFLDIPGGLHGIIIAETSSKGAEGILFSSYLKGIIRTLCRLTTDPKDMMTILNDLILKEELKQTFALKYLILDPKTEEYRFISCGYGSLWHIPEGREIAEKITTENIAIGVEANIQFVEISGKWKSGETLIMTSFAALESEDSKESNYTENILRHMISENFKKPADLMAEGLMLKVRLTSARSLFDRPLVFITVQRT